MKPGKMKSKPAEGKAQVVEFLQSLQHPLKKEIEETRKIILSADKNLTEHIKWNAPSFRYQDDDRITFNLHGKDRFRLIFHCGAKAKDNKSKSKLFEDTTGLLEWAANDRAFVKFSSMSDVTSRRSALIAIIRTWLKLTSS